MDGTFAIGSRIMDDLFGGVELVVEIECEL